MKFEASQRNPVAIALFLVTVVGLFGAVFLGSAVAKGQFVYLAGGFGGAALISLCLLARTNIWLLIPLCWAIPGSVGGGRIPFSIAELAVILAFGMYVIFYAMKSVPKTAQINRYNLLLYLNLAYLASVFLRNPVGVNFIQSNLIGGRPYFAILLALMAYWVLQHVTLSPKISRFFPVLMSIGAAASSVLGMITMRFPQLVPVIYPIYTGVNAENFLQQSRMDVIRDEGIGRQTHFQGFSKTVMGALVANIKPSHLALFLRPIWSILFYAALIAALYSGFRSGIVYILFLIVISSFFRGGVNELVKIGFVMLLVLVLLICIQASGVSLPLSIQRSLSFIPAPWDERAVSDAEGSVDWRVEMWKEALTSNKYIKNKLLGDGYGFDPSELRAFQASSGIGNLATPERVQEYFMITGSYHSGPVSAIRYVGYIGLLLFTIMLISNAIYAWKLMTLSKGTPFLAIALFVGTPALYKPFEYWLVFGALDSDYPQVVFSLAMLNLTGRSLMTWSKGQNAYVGQPTFSEINSSDTTETK